MAQQTDRPVLPDLLEQATIAGLLLCQLALQAAGRDLQAAGELLKTQLLGECQIQPLLELFQQTARSGAKAVQAVDQGNQGFMQLGQTWLRSIGGARCGQVQHRQWAIADRQWLDRRVGIGHLLSLWPLQRTLATDELATELLIQQLQREPERGEWSLFLLRQEAEPGGVILTLQLWIPG